ncbi:MAG: hypothetical protein NC095_11375 [Muribaculum sp.]|nr:hypothetical protein [Muribaculum sp.]
MQQNYAYLAALCASVTMANYASAELSVTSAPQQHVVQNHKINASGKTRTVLAEKQMTEGVTKRLVKDMDGRVFHDVVRNGEVSLGRNVHRPYFKAPQGATFFESFEGHAGELDWLPEGWTEINTEANAPTLEMCQHNINNTWNVQDTGDGYWTDITTDGVKECWIHFTYDWTYKNSEGETISGGPDPQDEWAITPSISIGTGQNLIFLAEIDLGSIYSFDWGAFAFDRTTQDSDLEVLISTDNGENWATLWSASADVCAKMTDNEMYNEMGELSYKTYTVSLAQYEGHEAKIAFRYTNAGVGFSGNSMAIDAVTVGTPSPEANYELPLGTLLLGISEGLHVNTQSIAMYPAWSPITWQASSNSYTEKNEWTFQKEAGPFTLEGNSVEIEYPWSEGNIIPYPELTASNQTTSDTFSFDMGDEEKGGMIFGGTAPMLIEETVYVGNYDYQHKHLVAPYLGTGAYCFGTSPANTWGTGLTQTAIGNLFYAPASPFTINDAMLTLGELDADDDAVFTLDIYEINDYGQLSETPVATSYCKAGDVDGFGFYNMIFHLQTPYVMKGNTLMMVSGFANTDKVREFAACAQSIHNDINHNYAYMMFSNSAGQRSLYAASEALIDYSSALYLSLNGTFHFIRLDEEIADLDKTTNSVVVDAVASNAPSEWYVKENEQLTPLTEQGVSIDWLTISPITNEDGTYAVEFSADHTSSSRAKTIVLANDGGEARIRIRQDGTVGVEDISFDPVASEIYDIRGYRIKSSIESLTPGLYIIRNGAKVSKFIKD